MSVELPPPCFFYEKKAFCPHIRVAAEPTSYLHHGEVLEPRLCVAMFDYDPKQLSPNLDNDSELPFRRGDVLKIYGDMDDDGFYRVCRTDAI